MPSQPASSGRTPRKRPAPPTRPPARKELKPWQLGAFLLAGLAVLGIALGFSYARKFHQEYGQYPWAKTAVPPSMYYAHRDYKHPETATLTGKELKVGTTPGGGVIYATTTSKKPVPTLIWVKDPKSPTVRQYSLSGGP